jgi:hypothetical protein
MALSVVQDVLIEEDEAMTEPHHQDIADREDRYYLDLPDERQIPETAAERAAKEPLFNKKVMFVWAAAALAVWFSFSVVIPAAFNAVKLSLREAVTSAETAPDGSKIIRLKNGKTITITKHGRNNITISTGAEPGAAAPAPAAVEAPAKPAEPVEPATPAPAAPVKKN